MTGPLGGPVQLALKGRVRRNRDSNQAAFDVEGLLSNFKIDFAKLLTIDFEWLTFGIPLPAKKAGGPKIKDFTFGEDLAFVKPILELLDPRSGTVRR